MPHSMRDVTIGAPSRGIAPRLNIPSPPILSLESMRDLTGDTSRGIAPRLNIASPSTMSLDLMRALTSGGSLRLGNFRHWAIPLS